MPAQLYESTLNTWLAGQGLNAKPESGQGGGKRLDVEVNSDGIRIALEAEIGYSSAKKASALKDADSRLRDDLADCAIAICYPAGLQTRADLDACALLYTLRTKGKRLPPAKTDWKQGALTDLANFIRKVPDELGDPDNIANELSFALDAAVSRLSESQKIDLAQTLDLPAGKRIKIGENSRYNQAAKRAMLVVATAVMFQARLDSHRDQITPRWDERYTPPRSFEGEWPPPLSKSAGNGAMDAI